MDFFYLKQTNKVFLCFATTCHMMELEECDMPQLLVVRHPDIPLKRTLIN